MQRKIIFMSVFLLFTNYAAAGWQIVKETRDGILYIDPESIQKNGDYISAVSFQDFHKMQSHTDKSFLSAKFKNEYDCKNVMFRQVERMLFPENMANGELLFSENSAQNWASPQSGSPEESLLRLACTN